MSDCIYIPELNNRELCGRLKDIWEGTAIGMTAEVMEAYRRKWREESPPAGGVIPAPRLPRRDIGPPRRCCGKT